MTSSDEIFEPIFRAIEKEWLENMSLLPQDVSLFGDKTKKAIEFLLRVGDASLAELSTSNYEGGDEAAMFFHFKFAERLKDVCLFWRDLLFQHLRGKMLLLDHKITDQQLRRHWAASEQRLEQVLTELKEWVVSQQNKSNRPSHQKTLEKWRLQNNPWPIYRDQLAEILNQCLALIDNHALAQQYAAGLRGLSHLTIQTLEHCNNDVLQLISTAETIRSELEKDLETSAAKAVKRLQIEEENLPQVDFSTHFSQELETLVSSLPATWELVIGVKEGLMVRPEIQLRVRVQQWLEGEVVPKLFEVFHLVEKARNTLHLAYSNMRNRSLLIPSGTIEPTGDFDFYQPLQRGLVSLQKTQEKIGKLSTEIKQRLSDTFLFSNVYDARSSFLPIPMQTSIRQFGIEGNRFYSLLSETLKLPSSRIQRFLSRVEREEGLRVPEKVVRYLEHRKPHPDNENYNPIFLTAGYLGASFASGRTIEAQHFEDIYLKWNIGYRGAVLLSGSRFCGKTFFGEWIAGLYFQPSQIISLNVSQETRYQGRKLAPTSSLANVLEFVRKHSIDHKPLIWIDNLELWQDTHHTLYENVKALMHFIDHYATRCFILVSINHWARQHLQDILEIDQVFQGTIQLDRMTRSDISKAILIRHGATHKKLTSADGSKLSPRNFNKLIKEVEMAGDGNIGEILRWWTASVVPLGEYAVTPRFSATFSLPDNFDAETSLLLTYILIQKRTNEYRLRKHFGPAFNRQYSDIIRRLVNMGLLVRMADGTLEINDLVVNDLGAQLIF